MAQDSKSAATVTVACKLPHGIVLQACAMESVNEPVMGGGSREVKKAIRLPDTFTIAGNAFPEGSGPRVPFEGGFALTHDVPKDLWEAWLKDNKDLPAVKNSLIFAMANSRDVAAKAREMEGVRSGFERLDPTKLPRGIQKAELAATS